MVDFFLKDVWGLEDEGEMVYKVLRMAFKSEPRIIFMQIGWLGIPDESELIKRELPTKKKGIKKFWELRSET